MDKVSMRSKKEWVRRVLKFDEPPPSLLAGIESLVSNGICHEDLPWAMFKNGLIQMISIVINSLELIVLAKIKTMNSKCSSSST